MQRPELTICYQKPGISKVKSVVLLSRSFTERSLAIGSSNSDIKLDEKTASENAICVFTNVTDSKIL